MHFWPTTGTIPLGANLPGSYKEAAVVDNKDSIHWTSTGYSVTYSHDSGMDTECTAPCARWH